MNNTKKKKGRYGFNIIDFMLLAVIVLSLSAILFLFFYDGDNTAEEESVEFSEITYTVKQSDVLGILRGKINIGDTVYEKETMKPIGQVIRVDATDSKYTYYDSESKTWIEESYPNKIDIVIEISVNAVLQSDGRYSIDGYTLNVGEEMDLRFPFYTGKAMCISVSGGGEK